MNRQGPGKIEWCDYSWNPITGCRGGCEYCYARRIYRRFGLSFEPTWHEDEVYAPARLGKPARIFCCSVSDPFGEGVEPAWVWDILDIMHGTARHTYYLLTKRPDRIAELVEGCYVSPVDMPQLWLGVTVTCEADLWRVARLICAPAAHRFISVEPLLGPVDLTPALRAIKPIRPEWVIIGAQTGPGARPVDQHAVSRIVQDCIQFGVPFFVKDNVLRQSGAAADVRQYYQQWPEVR